MAEAGVAAENAIDGDPATYWCSKDDQAGQNIIFEFGSEKTIKSIVYTPRVSGSDWNCTGRIISYVLERKDGENWVEVKRGDFNATGPTEVALDSEVTTSALRLSATASYHWDTAHANKAINVAEFDAKDASGNSVIHSDAPAAGWSIEANSVQPNDGGGAAALIDGDMNTFYHSAYDANGEGVKKAPYDITIDRGDGALESFQTVGYAGRSQGAGTNGNFQKFELYVSDSKENLFDEANKKDAFKVDYAGAYEDGHKMIYFGLDEAQTGRYVGVRVLEGVGGFAAGAELDLYKEQFTSVPEAGIATSDLTLKDVNIGEAVGKNGKMITFTFEPIQFGTGDATVVEKVVMHDGDHFMRKFLEIELKDKNARINFIDGEHFVTAESDKTWTIPTDAGGIVSMNRDRANLGQPIYINGMFIGSEFPVADTQIVDGLGRARYWTGKNFNDFERDDQLADDGKYVSWQTVCGASRSDGSDTSVIQTDFFAYITSIAKPSDFRIQYNSWFDNMMFIDDENILESFKAVDKHLNETGVRPLESYVVDDGWNNYRMSDKHLQGVDDYRRNGEGINEDGFWTFNSKFPNGLTPSSSLVQKLGSNFGVWIGPRGGYNYQGDLAKIIEKKENGSEAGGSIDVADDRYVTKFTEMAVGWMRDYGVNYWKWDGFADDDQYNAFQQGEDVVGFDADHQHMYGGPNGVFHSTDLWEKWIVLFDKVWETASKEQIQDLWVSLTCYVNPSPWFMQWSNSVWIQCVGDRGEVHNAALTDKMNTMLTYRDACYYDFINNHEFQFPLANIYNHDPIYGKEGTGITADSMNGEEFRNYLFMQGTRGTAFWELYYSDSLFDEEKWLINADFLKWEEENFDMLRNAKWVGGNPSSNTGLSSVITVTNPGTQDAYGFSGFNTAGNEGIISMRNPAATEQTITFTLDAGIGCTAAGTYNVVLDHAYTEDGSANAAAPATVQQGQTVTMTLKPGEVQIWHLSQGGDTTAPELTKVELSDATTVRVQASEHVFGAAFEVTADGKKVELGADALTAYADQKTFDIALPSAVADNVKVEVKAIGGADSAGNKLTDSMDTVHYENGVIASAEDVAAASEVSPAGRSVTGNGGFAVTATVKDPAAGATIVSQGDQWSLGVNAEGKATFTVLGVTAVSDSALATGDNVIAGVRENNGMIKLYIDGELAGSAYGASTSGRSVTPVVGEISAAPIVAGVNAKSITVNDSYLGYDEVPASPLAELVEKIESERGKFTEESWTDANMDELLKQAKSALEGTDAGAKEAALDALNKAYGKLVPETIFNLAADAKLSAAWVDPSITSEVTNAGSPLANAVDGNASASKPHAIFGHDGVSEGAYMQLDLGEECRIDEVNLWRFWDDSRIYNGTALVVANKEDFSDAQVLYYSGDQDLYGLGEDALTGDKLYGETAEGKKLYGDAEGDKPVTARYVRLYGHGVKGGGQENHIVELQVIGAKLSADPYDIAGLKALVAQAEDLLKDEDAYTAETVKALKEAVKAAQEVIKVIEAGATDKPMSYVLDVREALESAIDGLKPVETPDPEPEPEPSPDPDPDPTPDPDPDPKPEPGPDPDPNPNPNPDPAPNPDVDQKPAPDQEKPGDGGKPDKKPGAGLPGTGDASLIAVAGVAAAGIGIAAAGVALAKRRK